MEIHDLPDFVRHSRFLSTKYLVKLAQVKAVPTFKFDPDDGTIETACEVLEGKEKEVVLTRHAINLLEAGDIDLAWQALLAIHEPKTYE